MSSALQSAGRESPGRDARRYRHHIRRRHARIAYSFLAPALLVMGVFVIWPMIDALRLSFTDDTIFGDAEWIGLDNYRTLVTDDAFRNALKNTLIYAVVTTPVSVVIALVVAIMLNRAVPARGFFRAVVFLPFVASLAIVAVGWSFLLDPQLGLVTAWLRDIGISTGDGIRDPDWALPGVMLVGVWRNIGFFMVMFLAGLQSIPRELYEASTVDGANAVQRFRSVTVPLLSNTTMFVTIIATIFSFQAFDQIYVMTGGGPFFRSETLLMFIYRTGFSDYQMGYASAVSWVLVLIILVLSVGQLAYFNRRVVRY